MILNGLAPAPGLKSGATCSRPCGTRPQRGQTPEPRASEAQPWGKRPQRTGPEGVEQLRRSRLALRFIPIGVSLALLTTACFKRGVTPIRTQFNQGVYHYSTGDYQAAISAYRLAVEEHAGDHRARFNLAEALEAQATQLELDDQPDEAEALRREAEEHYRELLAGDPGHLRANVNLAAREIGTGDPSGGEARLRSAIERHPRSALPRVALAAHRLAADEPVSIREAITLLEAAVDRDQRNVDANVLLGHAYAALERHGASEADLVANARDAYDLALSQEPADVGALLGLARLERRAGSPDRAQSYARRALYVLPDLLEAHLMLAEMLDETGKLEEATAHYWRSRQLENTAHPRLTPDEYRRRLLDLYRRLGEQEGSGPPS